MNSTNNVCKFCNDIGHYVKDCPTLQGCVCGQCKGKGHTTRYCKKSAMDINFPALSYDKKTVSTPSQKKSYELQPKTTLSSKKQERMKSMNGYRNEVAYQAHSWITMLLKIFGPKWFHEYERIEKKEYTDSFLNDVQSEVSDRVANLVYEWEEQQERSFLENEARLDKLMEKKREERKVLQKSMTEDEWDLYTQYTWDLHANDMSEYGHYYPSEQRKADARKVEALADWSAFLDQQEKSQEDFRETQSMKRYIGRPRKGLTLSSFM